MSISSIAAISTAGSRRLPTHLLICRLRETGKSVEILGDKSEIIRTIFDRAMKVGITASVFRRISKNPNYFAFVGGLDEDVSDRYLALYDALKVRVETRRKSVSPFEFFTLVLQFSDVSNTLQIVWLDGIMTVVSCAAFERIFDLRVSVPIGGTA